MELPNINNEEWSKFLSKEKNNKYFDELKNFLNQEIEIYGESLEIFPPQENIFECMNICEFNNLKVILLGQDPYHQKGQAMGLSFSVPENIKIPPSLVNIYKELKTDCNLEHSNGDLTKWAKQGVLLLNTSLTVRESCPNSHQKYWRPFTDNLIEYISDNKEGMVFLLWGGNAKDKKKLIDIEKHYVLEANHPSPLSANRGGWFGCKHFSKTNDYLKKNGKKQINW
jgi:uracil-DNA glycosylase